MKKYEIKTDSFEFPYKRGYGSVDGEVIFNWFWRDNTGDHTQIVASFDTLNEAKEAFKAYENYGSTRLQSTFVGSVLTGEVAWLEISNYYDDGECDYSEGVVDYSAEEFIAVTYSIVDDDGYPWATDIRSYQAAEAKLADLIESLNADGEKIPEGLEIIEE